MYSSQSKDKDQVREWKKVMTATVPKSPRKRDVLVAFFDWLLSPELVPQLRPAEKRSNLLRKVRTEQAHVADLRKTLARFGVQTLLDSVCAQLVEVERQVAAESQFRTYTGLEVTAKSDKAQGNIVETQRLLIAVLIARQLYPARNPFAVVSIHDPHRTMRSQRAIELRVRRYARTLAESGCEGMASITYAQFKHNWRSYQYQSLLTNQPRPLPMPIFRRLAKLIALTKSEVRMLKDLSGLLPSITPSATARTRALQ